MKYLQDSEDAKATKKVRPPSGFHPPITDCSWLMFVGPSGLGCDVDLCAFIPPADVCPLLPAESQARDGETQEGEDKPQSGEPQDSAAAQTGEGLTRPDAGVRQLVVHTDRLPAGSWGASGASVRLTRCLSLRKRRSAGWRRRRSWSTPSSFCRRSGRTRRSPGAPGAARSPSRTASPAACRGRPGSWARTGKPCCLNLCSRTRWPRASPAHTAAAQMRRGAATRLTRPAPLFSGTHPALCSASWCASPASGYAHQRPRRPSPSALRRGARRRIRGEPTRKRPGSPRSGAPPAVSRPTSCCGGRGPDRQHELDSKIHRDARICVHKHQRGSPPTSPPLTHRLRGPGATWSPTKGDVKLEPTPSCVLSAGTAAAQNTNAARETPSETHAAAHLLCLYLSV